MSFSDEIRANWDRVAKEPRQIVVPEWGRTLYVYPLTVQQMGAIAAEDNFGRRMARILLCRARNEDGSKMFSEDDFLSLVTKGVGDYGPEVLARVVGQMSVDTLDVEDAEKN